MLEEASKLREAEDWRALLSYLTTIGMPSVARMPNWYSLISDPKSFTLLLCLIHLLCAGTCMHCRDSPGDNKSKESAMKKLCADYVALLKTPFGKALSKEEREPLIQR